MAYPKAEQCNTRNKIDSGSRLGVPHQEQIINKIRLKPHTWTMFQTAATLYKFLAAKYVAAAIAVLVNGMTHLDKKLTQLVLFNSRKPDYGLLLVFENAKLFWF